MIDSADRNQPVAGDGAAETSGASRPGRRWSGMKVVKQIGLVFLVTGVLLGIVEGCASLSIGLWEVARGPRGRQMIHARYDAELGWVNLPSVDLPDVWGPGAGVRTNSQGIRARTEFEARVAPGRIRALCSGDSFAFGEGSGDLDTWCHLLTVLDDRLETVNLGQPGYGVGQSYLRYLRDGAPLDHQIHLFTFVDGDFDRAGRRSHYGYARPLLRLVGDELEVDNVPVPRVDRAGVGPSSTDWHPWSSGCSGRCSR